MDSEVAGTCWYHECTNLHSRSFQMFIQGKDHSQLCIFAFEKPEPSCINFCYFPTSFPMSALGFYATDKILWFLTSRTVKAHFDYCAYKTRSECIWCEIRDLTTFNLKNKNKKPVSMFRVGMIRQSTSHKN